MSGVRVSRPVQDKKTNMQLVENIKESYNELVHKVTWPTAKELTDSAVLVLVASLILALIILLIDLGFEEIMKFIYKLIG